jgi:hypothetical protein
VDLPRVLLNVAAAPGDGEHEAFGTQDVDSTRPMARLALKGMAPDQWDRLTPRQWEWLAQALYDATQLRLGRINAYCPDCDRSPADLCEACGSEWAHVDNYHELACQLGAALPAPQQPRRLRVIHRS